MRDEVSSLLAVVLSCSVIRLIWGAEDFGLANVWAVSFGIAIAAGFNHKWRW